MNTIILNGLKISTSCKFVKFIEGTGFNITEDQDTNTCKVTFMKGTRAGDIVDSRAICISPEVNLHPTDWIRICNPQLFVEGLTLRSIAPFEYQIQQYIVDGIEEFYADFNEGMCIILIPKNLIRDIDGYLKLLETIPYLEIINVDESFVELHNIYGVQLYRTSLRLKDLNSRVFNPKANYERYLVRDVDYLGSFFLQLEAILKQYGIELVRYPVDKSVNNSDRLVYKVTEYQLQELYKSGYGAPLGLTRHKSTIEFEGSFLNQIKLEDFRTRYQDVRLVSDFTTFTVKDKLGRTWRASLKWGTINTDWNSDYNTDNLGNAGLTCNFNVELRYYIVYDMAFYNIIKSIMFTLEAHGFKDGLLEDYEVTKNDYKEVTDIPLDDSKSADEINEIASEDLEEWIKLRS